MKKKYMVIFITIFIILVSSISLYAINRSGRSVNRTAPIALYTIPDREKVFVNGIVTPEKTENIFLDNTKGNVNKVSVNNGQAVKKGDILFTYKNDQITDQVEQLNRQITSSNNQKKQFSEKLTEAKKLLAKQKEEAKNQGLQSETENNAAIAATQTSGTEAQISGYQDQIDSIQNQIDTNQDQLKILKEKEFTVVTSPIDGKVLLSDSQKDITKPFIVIESVSFYIKGNVNEKDQPKLKENQTADIFIFSTKKTLTGKVKNIGNRPVTEPSTQAVAGGSSNNISYYDVNISIDSQEYITNGFHVQVTVKLSSEKIKIPKSSIFEEAGKKYVFKTVNKKLTKQEVTYEGDNSSEVVVISGLKENDNIAKNAKDMKEGMSVE
ncbi:efflux RND transporter periplasmic adaptor subunit [Clostridium omnivorum]|uniref:ABC transporter permease n=1 Tax=Clostridium omnivorum TaxID=1604902 RepID=A0ABQ5N6G5_9CLOT|nr:efflux RND transporter periplasmic adaptor subunit [Clostridium sp. E14]GLC30699.1 ABC transporter permease [Clostridium sp. E14]